MVMTLISTPHLQQRKQGFKWVPSKKPEMDLNEFLQQMEILKDNSQAEVSQVAECDSTPLWKEQEETGS